MSLFPIRILIALILWGAIFWGLTRPKFFKYAVGETTAGALGAIRMLVCGRLLMMVLWEDLKDFAILPDELRNSMGVMGLFYKIPLGFEHLLHNPAALTVFKIAVALLLFLGMIGWRSRLTVPLGGFGAFIISGLLRQYSFFWHQDLIALYIVGILSLTPCGDGWSLDRLIAIAKGRTSPKSDFTSPVYGWARYACWTALALPYVAAGLSKLRNGGLLWWNGVSLRRMLLSDTLSPKYFDFDLSLHIAHLPEIAFAFLGLSAVIAEVAYGLVLVWPKVRPIIPAVTGLMHIGIIFLQKILFLDLIMLQLLFFDFTSIRKKLGVWLNKKRAVLEVLYDGNCRMCLRTIEILKRLDLFERLRFIDFRSPENIPSERTDISSLSPTALADEMHVILRGRVFRGFDSYRQLAQVLPLGWIIAPFLWFPGVSWIGSKIYSRIAQSRHNILSCGPSCRLETPNTMPANPVIRTKVSFANPLAIAGLAAILLNCWIYQTEFFPFTALQMYSQRSWRSQEPVVFYKVLAQYESGEMSSKGFDEAVGIFATNGRYRILISDCFRNQKGQDRMRLFLTAYGTHYNKHAKADRRIKQLEVQKWDASWENPKEQRLLDHFKVPL